jgi:hypothetical protein
VKKAVELVPFDSTDRLDRVGISDRSISEIFLGLGAQIACSEPRLVSGTPTYAKEFVRRELRETRRSCRT